MKQIHFATKNKGKVSSVSSVLSGYDIKVVQIPLDMPEPRSDDLREIAREKVLFAFRQIKKPCIALDAGFYIHSLNGFPKAFVNLALETIGIEGILKLVEKKPRECEFRNCMAYLDNTLSEPVYFESGVEGKLSENPRGSKKDYFWSELFFVFIPVNESKTLAEMTPEQYKKWREKRLKDSFATKFAEWFWGR